MSAWTINNMIRTPLLLMAGVEMLILYSSVYFAGIVAFGSLADSEQALGPLAPKGVSAALVMLICMVAMGLYQFHERMYFREAAARVMAGIIASVILLLGLFYAGDGAEISNQFAVVAVAYSTVLLLFVRYFFVHTVDRNIFRKKTLVYGVGRRASSIGDLRRRADRRGFQIVGKIIPEGEESTEQPNEIVTNGKSVWQIAEHCEADEIVVAMDDRRGNLPIPELLEARLKGIEVIDIMEFLERETGKIRVDLVNPGWLIFSSGFRSSAVRRFNKRMIDLLASTLLLVVMWPVILLVAIAIKIEEGPGAPVFYRQVRCGRGGKRFSVLKFRSMRENAESDGKAVWAGSSDSRITVVGRWLRKSRLDELPQILNIVQGNMSFVGPRPERPEFVESLCEQIPYYSERHTVQPGLTGWAQLKYGYGASREDAIEKLQYDLYYVKNHSLLLDLLIILQTVEVVLWGKGAR